MPSAAPAPAVPPASTAIAPTAPPAATPAAPGGGTPATVLDVQDYEGIIGRNVRSAANEDMGRIIDVILDRDGRSRAVIIDFGGFLGVGSRKIAVDWRAVQFASEGRTNRVVLQLTRNQVRVSPEYKAGEPIVVLGPASPSVPGPEASAAPPASATSAAPAPPALAPAAAPGVQTPSVVQTPAVVQAPPVVQAPSAVPQAPAVTAPPAAPEAPAPAPEK